MLSAPSRDDLTTLSHQLAYARRLIADRYDGSALPTGRAGVEVLQRLLDDGGVTADDPAEVAAVGVAFGTLLVDLVPGLDWAITVDAFGREATLRYRATSIQINALSMIARRLDDGDRVDLADLIEGVQDAIQNIGER